MTTCSDRDGGSAHGEKREQASSNTPNGSSGSLLASSLSLPSEVREESHQVTTPPSTTSDTKTDGRKLQCQICQASFSSRSQLFKHLRSKHPHALDEQGRASDSTSRPAAAKQRTAASIAARAAHYNADHDSYYQLQCQGQPKRNNDDQRGIMTQDEWSVAREKFRQPLPVAFRWTNHNNNNNAATANQNADSSDDSWRNAIFQLIEGQGDKNPEANKNNNAYLQSCPYFAPGVCHVAQTPTREWTTTAQKALADAQQVGILSRQELCSLVPPILLFQQEEEDKEDSYHPNNKNQSLHVLDLCAAPGSKSLQLLDQMNGILHARTMTRRNHDAAKTKTTTTTTTTSATSTEKKPHKSCSQQEDQHDHNVKLSPPSSPPKEDAKEEAVEQPWAEHDCQHNTMLVVNDTNRSRLLTVLRRSRVMPGRQQVVFNSSDGRFFPALRKWGGYKLKFHRILADVPCSGDGTLRKMTQTEWSQWNVRRHLQLHKLQLRLLIRALELVQKGGRVAYSTCSLDPIENEAVVASAIARLGGPTAYRIVKPPDKLHPAAAQRFDYTPGATTWRVPHAKFSADHSVLYQEYRKVPKSLQKKDITPSMFPPGSKLEANWEFSDSCNADKVAKDDSEDETARAAQRQKELEQALFYGDILTPTDAKLLQEMLPNCCRILPQHLDSGGFFCAVIERVNPVYFPVCCPALATSASAETSRDQSSADATTPARHPHHGIIYHPITSIEHLRKVLAEDQQVSAGRPRESYFFEGVATLELAQQWLRQHGAFVPGRSNSAAPVPTSTEMLGHEQDKSCSGQPENTNVKHHDKTTAQATELRDVHTSEQQAPVNETETSGTNKSPMYTPMFRRPQGQLLKEFCDFFGLKTDRQSAKAAQVPCFPVDSVVIGVGGGQAASEITTCLDPDEAHYCLNDEMTEENQQPSGRHTKRRFFQLVLVSNAIRNLFAGGARFSPIEAGLALCWIPIPGPYCKSANSKPKRRKVKEEVQENDTHKVDGIESRNPLEEEEEVDTTSAPVDEQATVARPEQSGLFGLVDESVEFLGYYATKRLLYLTPNEVLELLERRVLALSPERSRYGPPGDEVLTWSPGAVIAVFQPRHRSKTAAPASALPKIWLACCLREVENGSGSAQGDLQYGKKELYLLTEQKLSSSWLRLIRSVIAR